MKLTLSLLLTTVILQGQQQNTGPRTLKGTQDFSAATLNLPNGTATPASCNVGDTFFKTNATAGQNSYSCTSTNTWTVQAGSGGSGITGLTTNGVVAAASSTTVATPCATCTLDSSGNYGTPGGVNVGVGGSVAGSIELAQGTAPTAGTTSVILYAPTSVTSYKVALPSAAATGIFKWSNSAGTITSSVVSSARGISFAIGDPAGAALSAASTTTDYITVPFACTISAYNLLVDSGTITVKFWKVATGTAIPTAANSINTAGVGIASGTAVHATVSGDFTTTTVAANDILAMNVTATSGPKFVNGVLQCDQ